MKRQAIGSVVAAMALAPFMVACVIDLSQAPKHAQPAGAEAGAPPSASPIPSATPAPTPSASATPAPTPSATPP